jgi:hypothetical protein
MDIVLSNDVEQKKSGNADANDDMLFQEGCH